MLIPLALFFSHGGWPTAIAAFVMVCFHLGILSAIPMGVPLEWNVFMIFCVLSLFVAHAHVGITDLTTRGHWCCSRCWPRAILGNMFPRKISFLPGMRYYAGNWTPRCGASSRRPRRRSTRTSSRSPACPPPSWRSSTAARRPRRSRSAWGTPSALFNTHGKALFTLAHRAMAGQNEDDYSITDGERICSMAIGWNLGDGHRTTNS
jgi:hypothetical protein